MLTCPHSGRYAPLNKMLAIVTTWAEAIRSSTLLYHYHWHSLCTQLVPSIRYEPLMTLPAILEESFLDCYYQVLPLLNVNRSITSDWQWLPCAYQGLGVPNLGVEKLMSMLQYLHHHWGCAGSMDFKLRQSFELLQVDCGLKGNPFLLNFNLFNCLTTNTWMKLLWQYIDSY